MQVCLIEGSGHSTKGRNSEIVKNSIYWQQLKNRLLHNNMGQCYQNVAQSNLGLKQCTFLLQL